MLCPGLQDSEEIQFSAGLMAVNTVIQGPGSSQQALLGRMPLPKLWNQCKVVCGILLLDYHWQPPKIGLLTELTLKLNRTKGRAWKNHQLLLSSPISFLPCLTSWLEIHLHLFTFMKHFNENRSTKDRTTQLWQDCWSIYGTRTWGGKGSGTRILISVPSPWISVQK